LKISPYFKNIDPLEYGGRVTKIIAYVEASGPASKIGDICKYLYDEHGKMHKRPRLWFRESNVVLMPFGNLKGVGSKLCRVHKKPLHVPVGHGLIGDY
jgi:flagellum-specific ATP synthase